MSRKSILTGVAGLAAGLVLGATPWASAGHLNTVLEAELDGRSEVTTGATDNRVVGDPNGRGEIYVFGIDGDLQTLCYVLQVERIGETELAPGGGRAAHIHRGAEGTNGPVVANLAWPQDGQAADCLTIGEAGKFPTNVDADPTNDVTIADILDNPNGFYVNVHNAEYPSGAVRGQLQYAD